nr:hypothetical protein [Mycobacterium sp. 1164966.3]
MLPMPDDLRIETVDAVGHWIVEERPDLVLHRLPAFLEGNG